VIDQVRLPCTLELPAPPPGTRVDPEAMALVYSPGDGSAARSLPFARSETACGGNDGFFVADDIVSLCPTTCTTVIADETGTLTLHAACPADDPVGEGEGEGEACTECSCGAQACIDGACAACGDSDDCCPGLICVEGACVLIGG
jgi:hypothetical protein